MQPCIPVLHFECLISVTEDLRHFSFRNMKGTLQLDLSGLQCAVL